MDFKMIRVLAKLNCSKSKLKNVRPGDIFVTKKNELCILINRSTDNKSLIKSFVDNTSYIECNDIDVLLVNNSVA